MAVAVAPEVAAALAAATAAKEISDKNDPSKPTKKPTDSAQSATATITSGTPSSPVTSSATLSSSSGCPACVECADSTIAPGPSPAPEDPFPQWTLTGGEDDGDGGNASTRKTRRRFPHSLEHRATTDREIEICQATVQVPPYNSWNGAGIGNAYSSYYSYKYSNAKPGSCVKYDFDIVSSSTQPDNKGYATEHVYEIQLINLFLNWMKDNNAALQAFLATKNNKQPPAQEPRQHLQQPRQPTPLRPGLGLDNHQIRQQQRRHRHHRQPAHRRTRQPAVRQRPLHRKSSYLEDGLNGMEGPNRSATRPPPRPAFTKLGRQTRHPRPRSCTALPRSGTGSPPSSSRPSPAPHEKTFHARAGTGPKPPRGPWCAAKRIRWGGQLSDQAQHLEISSTPSGRTGAVGRGARARLRSGLFRPGVGEDVWWRMWRRGWICRMRIIMLRGI